MTGTGDKKPPTQIMQQTETLHIPITIYPPTLKKTIVQFTYDNCLIHLVGLIVAFAASFIIPLFCDPALGYTISFAGFLLMFFLGATLDIYGENKFRIWEDFFNLKK